MKADLITSGAHQGKEHRYALWTDQVEWFIVCAECYFTYQDDQWSGSTNPMSQTEFQAYKKDVWNRAYETGACEFCKYKFQDA